MPEISQRTKRCVGEAQSSKSPGVPFVGSPNTTPQRFVLAEYIKASQVDTEQLVTFIKTCNLQPDWFSMQLPGGEPLCQSVSSHPTIDPDHHWIRQEYAPVHARSFQHA